MFSAFLNFVIVEQLAEQYSPAGTFTSKSSIVETLCSHDIETSIAKTTITDHYTVLIHVKNICKLQPDKEKPFTVRLWKTLNYTSVLTIMDFKLITF